MTSTRRAGTSVDDAAERVLLGRIATRDRAAMREFYLLYHRRIARFLMRITRRLDLVDEIVNDTMMTVWQQAQAFRGASRVSTWVMGIAYRRGLGTLRTATRAQSHAIAPELASAPEVSQDDERREWVDKALETLSVEHRMVVELTYYGGYSCDEIATIMECPTNTVKTRLFYAREKLRDRLTRLATPTRQVS